MKKRNSTIQNSLNQENLPLLGLLNQSFGSSKTFVCLIVDMTQHQPVRVCKSKIRAIKTKHCIFLKFFLTALFELFLI